MITYAVLHDPSLFSSSSQASNFRYIHHRVVIECCNTSCKPALHVIDMHSLIHIIHRHYTHKNLVVIPRLNQSNSPDGSASDEP